MKQVRVYLISVLIMISIRAGFTQTPDWTWAKSAGSTSHDYGNAVCTDANENIFVSGTFLGSSITFGNYTLHNSSAGSLDVFVVKYDANGNVLWAKSGGGANDDFAYGVCADGNGSVYITGYFRSPSLTFEATTLINPDSLNNGTDIFITKYDAAGNLRWVRSAASQTGGWELSYAICSDVDSNVYVTGMYNSPITFGSSTLPFRGYYDVFIAKYDAGGNVLWAKSAGEAQQDVGLGICTDASKNVYVTGWFSNSAIFGSDTLMGTGSHGSIFVAKYDTYGNELWAKSATGPSFPSASGTSITADTDGNVYVTGSFNYSVIFGSDTLGNYGSRSIFIAKYDSSGNALWGRSPGGTGNDWGNSISADKNGNVFVTGYFQSSFINFGGFPILNDNVGYDDIFVAGYDASGNAFWAKSLGGQDYDYGMGVSTSTGGNVYVTGYFGSYSLDFANTTITNTGSYDIFLAKLSNDTAVSAHTIEGLADTKMFPNPAQDKIHIKSEGLTEITIYDIASRKVLEQQFANATTLNVSELASGLYVYELNKNGTIVSGKLLKD